METREYKVMVPVVIKENDSRDYCAEEFLSMLKKFGAERLSVHFPNFKETPDECSAILERFIAWFEPRGIEVALAISGLLHKHYPGDYVRRVYMDGTESTFVCPLDKGFTDFYTGIIARYAATGVKLIFVDDDFCIHCSGGVNCFCDLHMEKYRAELGENISREDFISRLHEVKPNKYRNAWLNVNGAALIDLAKAARVRVDAVNPAMRLGVCTGFTTEEFDGAGLAELARAFAGKTEPWLRLIGAPYHQAGGYKVSLANSIDIERMMVCYLKEFRGEIVSEGDVYPRPRFSTPAAYLEAFDMILQTEERFDGIFKLGVDFVSGINYETGYADAAERNKELYRALQEYFRGGVSAGWRAYEKWGVLRDMDFKEGWGTWWGDYSLEYRINRPYSVLILNDACMPLNFDNPETPVVLFGHNAKFIDPSELKNGAVLDLEAALILKERGVDTGIEDYRPAEKEELRAIYVGDMVGAPEEYFCEYGDSALIMNGQLKNFYHVKTKPGVRPASYFRFYSWRKTGAEGFLGSYFYENAGGLKFLTFCYEAADGLRAASVNRNYYRQRLLIDAYTYCKGERLDAVCPGHPDLYMLVKRGAAGRLSVGLWNLSPDAIPAPEVLLGSAYAKAQYINSGGVLQGDKVTLGRLEPYAFAGIVLEK